MTARLNQPHLPSHREPTRTAHSDILKQIWQSSTTSPTHHPELLTSVFLLEVEIGSELGQPRKISQKLKKEYTPSQTADIGFFH